MPNENDRPEEENQAGEEPRQRFRRLVESSETAEENSLTPLSEPAGEATEEEPEAEATGQDEEEGDSLADTQPTRFVSAPLKTGDKDDIPPDEADTGASKPLAAQSATPPPPSLGDTPKTPPPAVDERGMPLPRRVSETDETATQVTASAYKSPTRPKRPPSRRRPKRGKSLVERSMQGDMGCLLRGGVIALFAIVLLALGMLSFALYEYYSIAATLPSVDDLRAHASQFETTRILDRNGNVLYEILDPNAGRRTYVPLEDISPFLVAATVATEDGDFYSNPGFSPLAILRAFWQNISSGETVSGASTITQQLARMLLFTPEEATRLTYLRKVREAILATEITRRYSKDDILELYLNESYYSNLAYGVEAAAQTYFHTTADKLDLAQAAFLAGLPQAPSVYDIYSNEDAVMARLADVLRLLQETSQEQGCIYVSNNIQPICVSAEDATEAAQEIQDYDFPSPNVEIYYPHWVHYIRALLEERFDPQTIYRSGFTVYTTLDPDLQDLAQQTLQEQLANLEGRNVQSGAVVTIRPSTGEILTMVGSADFYNEDIDGQINMAISPRQPGSSIKPLTYTAAFEKGWTPSTLIWDVESEFPPSGDPDDPREPFVPVNYDDRYHGPVLLRAALANSYNVPAVKALDFVGVYDDPDTPEEEGLVALAHRMGITDLNEDYYGLSLTLGGGEVKLLDLTAAYAVFANGGVRIPPVAITRIVDHEGNVVFDYQVPEGEQVISAEHAYLISDILSDNTARTPAFGSDSVLNLPFTVAAKTGTTNDFRDNWTLGYTPDLAVGVWVGNPDFTAMEGTSGLSGAAPIWAEFMQLAIQDLTGGNPSSFVRPTGIVETVICAESGTLPSEWCPTQKTELFAKDQPH